MTRRTDGTFAPGQSGNPGGRPATAELRQLTKAHTAAAIKALASIMASKRAPAAARVSAATALLDRAYGKPIALNAFTDAEGNDVPVPERSEFESARRLHYVVSLTLEHMGLTREKARFDELGRAALNHIRQRKGS
jgi:hypothetical protein